MISVRLRAADRMLLAFGNFSPNTIFALQVRSNQTAESNLFCHVQSR